MIALDCEFDGHNGHLISIALVAENGDEFYEVVGDAVYKVRDSWVIENVIPFLGKKGIGMYWLREELWNFLEKHPQETIVADSPADFRYLLDLCHSIDNRGKYSYINLDIHMHFHVSGTYYSKIPHNALEDARALLGYLKQPVS